MASVNTPTSSPRTWLLRCAAVIAVALAGAVLATFSVATHPRFHNLPSSVDSQQAILEKRIFVFEGIAVDYPSWRNRIAVPAAMRALGVIPGVTPSRAYLLVRWLGACAALVSFAWLVRVATQASPWLCGLSAMALGLCLFPTFLHIYEVPSDFLDAAAISLLLGCVLQKRRVAFACIMLPALLNRESAIFAVGAWWLVHVLPFERRAFLRESVFCAALGAAGSALVIGVRQANALPGAGTNAGVQPFVPAEMFRSHWMQITDFLNQPNFSNPLFFLTGYFVFAALVAAAHWSDLPAALRRLGWCALLLYAISVPYGNLDELRINIPALVISTLLLSWLAFRRPSPAVA
jgi:hypothetical protein